MSNLWRGILRILHVLPKGIMWNVKNGMGTRFWEDVWLQDGPPLGELAENLPPEAANVKVVEMVLNGNWNLDYARLYLPEAVVMQLQLHPVPHASEADTPCWRLSSSVRFTVLSAYELTAEGEEESWQHPAWKAAWKVDGPQRVKPFFWLVLHNRLLSNAERRWRHFATADGCTVCGGRPETNSHVLRECSYARAVWAEVLSDEPDVFFNTSIDHWVMHYLSGQRKIIDSPLFEVTCWNLWKNRNNWVFEKQLASTQQLLNQVRALRRQIEQAGVMARKVLGAGLARNMELIGWKRSLSGWFCLNTDGSVTGGQVITAAGGVIRNDEGRFVKAFSTNLVGGSITHTEMVGIVIGLQLAWEEGCQKVLVQTDSAMAVQLLQEATPGHPHYVQVSAIRDLLAREWEVHVGHIFREGNVVADYLASVGHALPAGVHVFKNPSSMLSNWLYFDTLGIQTPRLVNS
ncbi:unnamed protein product [Linum trigynum]|uniref:RNase H type-1 domain-containing protein n=1 Tax=Linum trigynum TaxID=586398 RepID=A0AAV2FTE9_9ROSI